MHNKSGACPNKGGMEQFAGRAPYNKELEATFNRRIQIPLDMTPVQDANPAETSVSQEPTPISADPGQVEDDLTEATGQVEDDPSEATGQVECDPALPGLAPQVILPQASGSGMDAPSILLDAGLEAGIVEHLEVGFSQQPRSAQEYITGGMDASQMLMSLASGGVGLNIKMENVRDDDDDNDVLEEETKEKEEVIELDIN